MSTVDIHTHFHSLGLAGRAGPLGPTFVGCPGTHGTWQIGARRQAAPVTIYDADARVRAMDVAGIDVHVLASSPKWFLYNHIHAGQAVSDEVALTFAQSQNDDIARAVRQYPSRFVGLATLPLVTPLLAVPELERCLGELGLRGVIIDSTIQDKGLDSEELFPIFRLLERERVPLFVHPAFLPDSRVNRYGLRWVAGFCFDEVYAIACLVFGGVMDRFPDLQVIVTHGGGAVPYLLGRLVEGSTHRRDASVRSSEPFDVYLRSFYYDSCLYHPAPLKFLVDLVGPERVLFGTNFPGSPEMRPTLVDALEDLSVDTRAKILGGTAAGLFRI